MLSRNCETRASYAGQKCLVNSTLYRAKSSLNLIYEGLNPIPGYRFGASSSIGNARSFIHADKPRTLLPLINVIYTRRNNWQLGIAATNPRFESLNSGVKKQFVERSWKSLCVITLSSQMNFLARWNLVSILRDQIRSRRYRYDVWDAKFLLITPWGVFAAN